MVWWTTLNFLGLRMLLQPCNLTFCSKPTHKGKDTQVKTKKFNVIREVLHNNYQSHNLVSPYYIWGISLANSTLITRIFLWAGHETRPHPLWCICCFVHHFISALVFENKIKRLVKTDSEFVMVVALLPFQGSLRQATTISACKCDGHEWCSPKYLLDTLPCWTSGFTEAAPAIFTPIY